MVVNSLDYKKGLNFWELNPNLLAIKSFKELYDSDTKSKNKTDSSNIMWSVCLIYHPQSTFKNLPLKIREGVVFNFVGIKDLNDKKYKNIIDDFVDLVTTSAQRQLMQWNRILDEKSDFMKEKKYDEESWEMLENMMKSNVSLYKEYERILDALSKDGSSEGKTRGGGLESSSEKGSI
jgi:hypothetical protein